jgi:hypothetical protein
VTKKAAVRKTRHVNRTAAIPRPFRGHGFIAYHSYSGAFSASFYSRALNNAVKRFFIYIIFPFLSFFSLHGKFRIYPPNTQCYYIRYYILYMVYALPSRPQTSVAFCQIAKSAFARRYFCDILNNGNLTVCTNIFFDKMSKDVKCFSDFKAFG